MSDAKSLIESIEKDFRALKAENKHLKIMLAACEEIAKHNANCFGEASKALAGMTDLYNKAQEAADKAQVFIMPTPEQAMYAVMTFQEKFKTNVTGTTNWAANLGMFMARYVAKLNEAAKPEVKP